MATPAFLQKAYLAYFGRPVDTSGAIAFANSTEAQVEAAFSASAESQALYGPTFNLAQVNAIYNVLFGRDADLPGAYFWLNQVASGAVSPAGAAVAILNNALGNDITIVSNKLAASASFTANLDTISEALGYSGDAAAASARSFLSTVKLTAATPAAVTAAVAETTAVGGVAGQTFTLTTGRDSGAAFTGGAGADTLTALATTVDVQTVVDATTLGSADSVDGGDGIDTFNLFASRDEDGVIYNGSLVGSVNDFEIINISGANFIDSTLTVIQAAAIVTAETALYGSDAETGGDGSDEGTEGLLADAQADYDEDVADLADAETALEAAEDALAEATQAFNAATNDFQSAKDVWDAVLAFSDVASDASEEAADIVELLSIATSEVADEVDSSVADSAVLQAMIVAAGAATATVATVKAAAFAAFSTYESVAAAAFGVNTLAVSEESAAQVDVSDAETALYGSDGVTGGEGSDEGTEGLLAEAQDNYDQDVTDLEDAIDAAGTGNINAAFFGGSEQIWLVGENSDLVDVRNVTTQTVGLRDMSANNITINYAAGVTEANIALEDAYGKITVSGDDSATVATVNISGTSVGGQTLELIDGTMSDADDLVTLNVALAVDGDGIVEIDMDELDSVKTIDASGSTANIEWSGDGGFTTFIGSAGDDLDVDAYAYVLKDDFVMSVSTGAGDDRVFVDVDDNGNDGATVNVTTGEGDDFIEIDVDYLDGQKVAYNIDAGAGDDEVALEDFLQGSISTYNLAGVTGGEGTDTLVISDLNTDNDDFAYSSVGDFLAINNLAVTGSFETLAFEDDAGDSDGTRLDASRLDNFDTLEFRGTEGRNVVENADDNQTLVARDSAYLSASAINYDLEESSNEFAGDLTVVVTEGYSDLILRGDHADVTVDDGLLALGEDSPDSDLNSATINLISTVDADGNVDSLAGAYVMIEGLGDGFDTLTINGTGYAVVDVSGISADDDRSLITVDASGMVSSMSGEDGGEEATALIYYGQDDIAEMLIVGGGVNAIEVESRVGEYDTDTDSYSLMDTVEGMEFSFTKEGDFDVENGSDVLAFGWSDFVPAEFVAFQGIGFTSLKNAVETAAALETDSIVFQYDGATYIFAEEAGDGEGVVGAEDMLIKLVGSYDLEDVVTAANLNPDISNLFFM